MGELVARQVSSIDRMGQTYKYMLTESIVMVASDFHKAGSLATDHEIRVFRGYVGDVASALNVADQLVYRAIAGMQTMGCIERLVQGRKSPSIYKLIKPPDEREYHEMRDRSLVTGQMEIPNKWQRVQDTVNRNIAKYELVQEELARIQLTLKILQQTFKANEQTMIEYKEIIQRLSSRVSALEGERNNLDQDAEVRDSEQ